LSRLHEAFAVAEVVIHRSDRNPRLFHYGVEA
jgi:hypothetical protein